jgi:16S rRNA (guanine1207-N2)-methyltransferase
MTDKSLADERDIQGVYGAPPRELAELAPGAVQYSPLVPGAQALEALAPGALAGLVMLAPPGTGERLYAMAQALRALPPGAPLIVLASKDKGGSRLRKELEAFGCRVYDSAKRHHRICQTTRPETVAGLDETLATYGPHLSATLSLWTQPGVFSWDRIDPGSALLVQQLPPLAGRGADLGCGVGFLARAVLASPAVEHLALIDIDRRAIEAVRRNITDPRVEIAWDDVRTADLGELNFVVMNPPFHDGGTEDRALGLAFIRKAAASLRKGGTCWLVANRHLPYETELGQVFTRATLKAEAGGFKVYEARK